MIRKWKMNTLIGLIAFLFTFWLSVNNNTWQTALFRACIGFLLFFIWGYGIRFILQSVMKSEYKDKHLSVEIGNEEPKPEETEEESFQSITMETLHTAEQSLDFEKEL